MPKPTLITGGCGFVGRHLVKRLLKEIDDIWIIDNLSTGLHPDTWLKDWSKNTDNKLQIYSLDNKKLLS